VGARRAAFVALVMGAAACGGGGTSATAPTLADSNGDLINRGGTVAASAGCTGCHSLDGIVIVGPSWQGLFGSEEELADGSSVVVDEAYLRLAILDPERRIVAGFAAGVMPQNYEDTLSAEDIEALIALIRSLA